MTITNASRRKFLQGAAAISAAAIGAPRIARAASYPDQNIDIGPRWLRSLHG